MWRRIRTGVIILSICAFNFDAPICCQSANFIWQYRVVVEDLVLGVELEVEVLGLHHQVQVRRFCSILPQLRGGDSGLSF